MLYCGVKLATRSALWGLFGGTVAQAKFSHLIGDTKDLRLVTSFAGSRDMRERPCCDSRLAATYTGPEATQEAQNMSWLASASLGAADRREFLRKSAALTGLLPMRHSY